MRQSKLKITTFVSLLIVVLLISGGSLYVRNNISEIRGNAKNLSLAGRQSIMLSKIVNNIKVMMNAESEDDFEDQSMKLYMNTNTWTRAHMGLDKTANDFPAYGGEFGHQLRMLFAETKAHYEPIRKALDKTLVAEYQVNGFDPRLEWALETIMANESSYGRFMSNITHKLDEAGNYQVEKTIENNLIITGLVVAGISILFFAFLLPVLNKFDKRHFDLQKANVELETSKNQLRKSVVKQEKMVSELMNTQKELKSKNRKLMDSENKLREMHNEQLRVNRKLISAQEALIKS